MSFIMGISLYSLSIDAAAAMHIPRGDVNRAVNAERVVVSLGDWCRSYDGVAAPFLLSGIYGATLAAILDGKVFDFFCLDAPDGGRIFPAGPGRVRMRLTNGDEHELPAFEVLRAVVDAMLEVAEFLVASGYPDGSLILLKELARRAPSPATGWATE